MKAGAEGPGRCSLGVRVAASGLGAGEGSGAPRGQRAGVRPAPGLSRSHTVYDAPRHFLPVIPRVPRGSAQPQALVQHRRAQGVQGGERGCGPRSLRAGPGRRPRRTRRTRGGAPSHSDFFPRSLALRAEAAGGGAGAGPTCDPGLPARRSPAQGVLGRLPRGHGHGSAKQGLRGEQGL